MKQLENRNQLPLLLNELGLAGEGVEVGVRKGDYSVLILQRSRLSRFFSVDPWMEFSRREWDDKANVTQAQQDTIYKLAVQQLCPFHLRSVVLRMMSSEASHLFREEQLDFVYLDAQHHLEGIQADLELWFPKVKKGGIFAGHDYLDGEIEGVGNFGVKFAVDYFVKRTAHQLFVTTKEEWPTWYFVKGIKNGRIEDLCNV